MGAAAQAMDTSAVTVDDDLICLSFGTSVREINLEERWADFVLSTDTVDAYGDVVVQDWDLARYELNPAVLYGHRSWELPIGHAENVRVEKRKLLARLYFVDEKANPLAEQIWQGIVQKSIRAVSVGFRSKAGESREIDGKFVYVLTGNELVEVSIVPIGANPEAVAVKSKSMNVIRGLIGGDAVNTNNDRGEPAKEKNMSALLKTLAAVLELPASASEDDVIANVKAIKKDGEEAEAERSKWSNLEKSVSNDVGRVLVATGVDSIEKALGVIEASKGAVDELAKVKAELETATREKMIEDARRDRKITPHQVEKLVGKSLDFVKAFIDMQSPNPVIEDDGIKQPETGNSAISHNGKSFGDLTPGEKHELYTTNKALYDALKASASN